jgi:hypothetical protein
MSDEGYLNTETFGTLMSQATEVGQLLGGLRASVERRRNSLGI